jgi:hypothetical protein
MRSSSKLSARPRSSHATASAVSYDLKSVADYAIGPDAVVSRDDATAAIEAATQFVGHIEILLSAAPTA